MLLFQLGLAFYAQADTQEGFAPGQRDLLFALCTLSLALASRNAFPRPIDGIRHTGVYLFLHCTLRCPTNCHDIIFPTLYLLSLTQCKASRPCNYLFFKSLSKGA
jgi:hypothetical protein